MLIGIRTGRPTSEAMHPMEHGRQSPVPASSGFGPLVQRDYWAVLANCPLRPSGLVELAGRAFPAFPPPDKVRVTRPRGGISPLRLGERLDIHIRHAGPCSVVVIHADACSFTLGTMPGHPETGRITFGAYRNRRSDVIFHIRSRARSSTATRRFGFVVGGDPIQVLTWTDFIDRLAAAVGSEIRGAIRATSRIVDDEPEDASPPVAPTYLAVAD